MLTSDVPIDLVRRCYAEEIRFAAGLTSSALAEAFAKVPREHYFAPGPWPIKSPGGYVLTTTADPRELYHDALVGIDAARQLSSGHPSSIAGCIDLLGLRAGNRILHVGCGTGYFTAVMAEVVTASGRITAVEIDPVLAASAKARLAHLTSVNVVCGDGTTHNPGPVD